MENISLTSALFRLFPGVCLRFFTSILLVLPANAAGNDKLTQQHSEQMKVVIDQLKAAVRAHDFTTLISRASAPKAFVDFSSCGSSKGRGVTVDELMARLSDLSKNKKVVVKDYVLFRLGHQTIETQGWGGESSYVYFVFTDTGGIQRLRSVYDCKERSSDFTGYDEVMAKAGRYYDFKKIPVTESPLRELSKVVQNRNFELLRSLVPQKRTYLWSPCGDGDVPGVELSFEDFRKRLSEASRSTEIYFKPDFSVRKPDATFAHKDNDTLLVSDVHSVGWVGEYRYLSLEFAFHKSTGRWGLTGVCDSMKPPLTLNQEGKLERVKFEYIPPVSSTGISAFADPESLRRQLIEIHNARHFDTLKRFAPKGVIIFGECDRSWLDVKVKGSPTPIEDVIAFLKKNISLKSAFKYSAVMGEYSLEVAGWNSGFPYVAFWFTEESHRWEWTKLSYCQSPHTPWLNWGSK